ncbi:threonyl-tRNA synthetase [Candidatus Terasakiella magnetica]|uniref:Threonine--tRNA ligase n=1 Tax=Candidatus Terasakiella magnetica TaxID=1867952 RepID=A0A1C3RIH5_9PROT|nr:threonine--tRNA ligase [Candidatus Terasakiella magnetica]SCA57078.1 threonyl-tRNA synthetase [Candidatus Terasakiella magnetica]
MVAITLPDGSVREFEGSVTGAEVAADIGAGLAKAALAVRINGEMKDLSLEITEDVDMSIVTARDEDALELLRHDAAHIMAQAVQELFDDVQVTIGPAIENGYYYDFATKKPFTDDDLEKIQKKMEEIVDRNLPIEREVWERDELIAKFKDMGELYKAEIIESIPAGEDVTVYRQGDWFDMCRGPHLPSTGKLGKAFKLMKVAGAYWRGDSNNEMLQRIYGTAWADKKALRQYLHMLEEAEKRDHRKLGKEMELFHFQEEAVGSVFWHPHGWSIYRKVQEYMRTRLEEGGYVEVNTPQMVDRKLWEDSGHWEKFRENMFITGAEDKVLAIKPMNCPCHVQIFNQGLKSYRDLPLRMAEFGSCFRNEPSGALHGLMRVRSFTQDDAHIFCSPDQIISETKIFCDLLQSIYKDFGFTDVKVKFSDRPEVRAGSDETWDKAESALKEATEAAGLEWTLNPGEGAFYGPKLEFVLRDAIGRDWQCGTLQVDFVLPERLNADYIGEDGNKHKPVMLHRAILGSFERFIGILIENFAGRFPLWLAPQQVIVASITSDHNGYAQEVCDLLKSKGLSCDTDFRNESINYKIREHSHAKVPAILVVGGKEVENRTVAMRRLGGKTQEILALDEAVAKLVEEAASPCGE